MTEIKQVGVPFQNLYIGLKNNSLLNFIMENFLWLNFRRDFNFENRSLKTTQCSNDSSVEINRTNYVFAFFKIRSQLINQDKIGVIIVNMRFRTVRYLMAT